MKKKYCYVGIKTDFNQVHFITDVDFTEKTWRYDHSKPPLCLNRTVAENLAEALTLNGLTAFVAISFIEMTGVEKNNQQHLMPKHETTQYVKNSAETEQEELLSCPIEELQLSARAYLGLKHANINTIEQLVSKSYEDLQKLVILNERTLHEITEIIKQYKLSLKEE